MLFRAGEAPGDLTESDRRLLTELLDLGLFSAMRLDKLTARVFQHVTHHEPGTLVFANHMVAGQPLTRVFYEIYRDQEAANIHSRGEALQQLLASQDALVAGFHIDQLSLELAKGLPPGAT